MTTGPVQIPAIDHPDTLVAGLTARQLGILTATATVLYLTWTAVHTVIPLPAFLILAVPIGAVAALIALGQRDGLSLDRLMVAAIRQRLQPRYRVSAPDGIRPAPPWLTAQTSRHTNSTHTAPAISPAPLRLPAQAITDTGVIDLGTDGAAIVAVCSTVNFALRTPAEQETLIAAFGRYLHSLTAPVQILIRAERLDLSRQIRELRDAAGGLPHPALEHAAREHADYLTQLRRTTQLLRRQVLLILREPLHTTTNPSNGARNTNPLARLLSKHTHAAAHVTDAAARRAAQTRLLRRLGEATELLAPAGITVTALEPGHTTAVLAAACNPDSLIPPSAHLASADDIITTAPTHTNSDNATTDSRDRDGWAPDTTSSDEWQDDWDDTEPTDDTTDAGTHDDADSVDDDYDEFDHPPDDEDVTAGSYR